MNKTRSRHVRNYTTLILTVLLKDKGRLLVFCPGILLHASPFSDLQLKKENYFLMALSDHH